ncbi:MAG: hypothetical protein WC895_01065 [Candidatus Shapirobacteria bacterium]|jgi:hypothetical protein
MINRFLAQVNIGDIPTTNGKLSTTYGSISPLITSLLRNSLTLAGIILLGLLIFGGITFIMNAGSGDSKKAEQAKQTITSALIGFAVVFGAYLIIQLIELITGLNILHSNL